jgi:uncharacterized protein (DUF2164 family)
MKNDPLKLDLNRKKIIIDKFKDYMMEEMDEEIGDLKADLFLEFIKNNIGKDYYNKGVADSKKFLLKRMEDFEIDMDQIFI